LIVYKIQKIERHSRILFSSGTGSSSGGDSLRRAIRITVESGLLYSASIITFFAVYLANNNAQYAVSDCVRPSVLSLSVLRCTLADARSFIALSQVVQIIVSIRFLVCYSAQNHHPFVRLPSDPSSRHAHKHRASRSTSSSSASTRARRSRPGMGQTALQAGSLSAGGIVCGACGSVLGW
jgi:hypothetical protein